ncbi:MAG TPA: hypothetical protein VK530_17595 [Candidatus Acidoferrum sp.]|nr:hypothetical protein [Candidatus Acidoferrum sp.]
MKVPDVTKSATLELVATPDLKNVRELRIQLGGNVSGHGMIWGDNIKTQRFSGGFNIRITKPWTQTNCVLHYQPDGVTSGGIGVRYRFVGDQK